MKKILHFFLKILAKLTLWRYQPTVIGITGSVGKTSTKESVFAVLSSKFNVRQNIKNYNNEIGLPLTILGEISPGKSLWGWIKVFGRAKLRIFFKDDAYPKVLILEMGIDRPGDMKYLTKIVKCDIGIVTMIGQSHLEYFGTLDKTQKEKGELIKSLNNGGWAILNYDNEKTRQIKEWSRVKVLTYGFDEKADISARELKYKFYEMNDSVLNRGTSFKLKYNGSYAPINLNNVIGEPAVYASLAASAVGVAFGMNLIEISESLKKFIPPKGRMNLIDGANGSLIIDDTYNSSPQSTSSALHFVQNITLSPGAKKIAILGDMLELGRISKDEHLNVGKKVNECGACRLITVGNHAKYIAEGARVSGMSESNINHFSSSHEAGLYAKKLIGKNDLILVKGSQGIRMEKVVWQIMADPGRSSELLVRQDSEWLGK